ncbi:MAG: GNAT family N-acetyltransferase [Anaerolineaceae bacterium]|nr:GNAT family N-acetyltransferase [Anaerolineaceae bacterium]
MTIIIVHNLPFGDWTNFVKENPKGNIFHTPEMYEVYKQTAGYNPELWAAVENEHILALMIPVRLLFFKGRFGWLLTRAVVYGGVLSEPTPEGHEALDILLKTYKQEHGRKAVFTELRNVCCEDDIQQILTNNKFLYEEHLNYHINLDLQPEEIFQGIGKRTRRNIRHGLNQGLVTIEEVTDQSGLDDCYNLLCQTFRTAKVPLADSSLLHAAFNILYPQNMIRFTLARVDKTPVAISIELLYKDIAYGWFGGMDRKYSSYIPNELLMWNLLLWCNEKGYKLYDFGGAGKPNEEYGVRDFKAKFGGQLVCFGRNTWTPDPMKLKVFNFGYQIYRRLFI